MKMKTNDFKSKMFDETLKIVLQEYNQKEIDEYNDITEKDWHTFSPEFETKMSKILKSGKKFKDNFRTASLKILKKSAIIVLILLSVSFISLLSVEAIRAPIFKYFITVYEKYSSICFVSDDDEVYVPATIETLYAPDYIPDGYAFCEEITDMNGRAIYYTNADGIEIEFQQFIIAANITINTEGITTEDIFIHADKGIFYTNRGKSVILWNDGQYAYLVGGPIDKISLQRMAESVKAEK